jgi:hypothetical protein
MTLAILVLLAQQHDNHAQHKEMSKGDHMHRRFDDPAEWAKSFDDPARDEWQMPEREDDRGRYRRGHGLLVGAFGEGGGQGDLV